MTKECFHISQVEKNEQGNPMVVVVKEGEKGFFPTDYDWGNYDEAKAICEEQNDALGLSVKEVHTMVLQSMRK